MIALHVLMFLIALRVSPVLSACDYISFGENHTMCKYTGQGCTISKRVFSSAEKDEAVRIHNVLRQKVANGKQGGQPPASNMKIVKWEDELATIAQRWADQCTFGHDANRRPFKYNYAGQNVYIYWTSGSARLNVTSAVLAWYNEVTNPGFDKNNINPFKFDSGTGHYTQVVWANTEAIGCGYSMYVSRGMNTVLVVCNYGPGGNVIGTPMYLEGTPCTACNNRKCSTQYPGLCQIA